MRLQFTDNFTSKGLQHSQHHHLEPIAVVGFSLRFPQEATSAENFWQMLVDKGCAMTEWPKDRANTEAFYHPDADRTNTVRNNPFFIYATSLQLSLKKPIDGRIL